MQIISYKEIEYAKVLFSELNRDMRVDAEYHDPLHIRFESIQQKRKRVKIKTVAFVTDGIHESIDFDENSGINLISAKAPKENAFDLSGTGYISDKQHNKNLRTALRLNDVIISTVGTIGNCAVVENNILPANSDRHVGIVRIGKNSVLPRYLSTYFATKYGKAASWRETAGNVQPNLYIRNIADLAIPLPSRVFQQRIDSLVTAAHQKKQLAEKLYNNAENLLLAELGLLDWKPDTIRFTLGDREFEVEDSISRISCAEVLNAERMDAEHFQEKYYSARDTLVKAGAIGFTPLKELLINLTNGHTPLRHDLSVGEVPFLCAEHIADYEVTFESEKRILFKHHEKELGRTSLKNGDVLLTIKGRVGNAALVEDIPNPVNINQDVALLRLKETLPTWFVLAFLNSPFGKLFSQQLSTGGINPFLGLGNVRLLEIPVFSNNIMVRISDGTKESVHAAGTARTKSRQLLDQAKRAVEVFIEEGEKAAIRFLTD